MCELSRHVCAPARAEFQKVANQIPAMVKALNVALADAVEENRRLRAIVDPLNKLRENEGASVLVCCDDPAPDGIGSAVEVTDAWTEWNPLRFVGDNLAEALQSGCTVAEIEQAAAADKAGEGGGG